LKYELLLLHTYKDIIPVNTIVI